MGRRTRVRGGLAVACVALALTPTTSRGQEACEINEPSRAVLRSSRDTRIMQTHRSSNDGAAGLIWLKRSPNVRGIVGFDLGCLEMEPAEVECATLQLTIYDGQPTNSGSWYSAHQMTADWVEGNQSFNRLRSNGQQLGSFPGSGAGTTWDCRVDDDLAAGGSSDCAFSDKWLGGESCGTDACYQTPATDDAFYADRAQTTLAFDVTNDVRSASDEISWLVKVRDETSKSGSVKFYTRDGARFAAEADPGAGLGPLDLAPRLVLQGAGAGGQTAIELVFPSGPTSDHEPRVTIQQTGEAIGDAAVWKNLTTGESGPMAFGASDTWAADIPLALGVNDVEFTVSNACGGDHSETLQLRHATGDACGDGIVGSSEECDDGNLEDGDCCSSLCLSEPDGLACDDGDRCTQGDACQSGTCTAAGPMPSSCGNAHVCYDASETKDTPAFGSVDGLLLGDALGTRRYDVKRLGTLCVPAEVDGSAVVDGGSHRLSYAVRRTLGEPKTPTWKDVVVRDELGEITVDVLGADEFLSSAALELGSDATPPSDGVADAYLCHRLRVDSTSRFASGRTVRATDALENRSYELKKPRRLCLAASVEGEPPANADLHVLCYKAVRATGEAKHDRIVGEIRTADGFGPLRLDTRVEADVCVPASVVPPA